MSDLIIREATPADNDALIDLERRSPLVLGEARLVFDRSPNFLARRELQEHGCMLVAERDGSPTGVMAAAWYETLVGGELVRALYVHHGRVAVEYQRSGVATALARALVERWLGHVDLVYWYVLPDNQVSLATIYRVSPRRWPVGPVCQRFLLEAQGPAEGAPSSARPAQAGEVTGLINRTHSGRDLFMPYTPERFAARLSRSTSYGWRQILVRERVGRPVAVAGLWDLGSTLNVVRTDERGFETASRPAVILDYGFAEGEAREMAALLDDLGLLAAAQGRQELWISLDPESGLYDLMQDRPHASDSILAFNVTAAEPLPGRSATPYLDFVYW